MMKVAIVGLGLMGGSLGLCLKENKFISCVLGYDIDKENANLALKLGLIHELMSEFNPQELANCDIVVLATPVIISPPHPAHKFFFFVSDERLDIAVTKLLAAY